jgi:hypothetical protein
MSFRTSYSVRIYYGVRHCRFLPQPYQLRLRGFLPGSTLDDREESMRRQYSWIKEALLPLLHFMRDRLYKQRTKQKTTITYITDELLRGEEN